jgi:hypothetical protein
MINEPFDPFSKVDYNVSERRRMAELGQAMPDGSFPIKTRQDLLNAVQGLGRASDYESAKRHLIRRARTMELVDLLPEEWNVAKSLWSGSFNPSNHIKKTY